MSTTRRFSFGIKSLSVILSVLTVLVSLPLTVFANDIRNLVNKNNEPDRSEGESGVFSSYGLVELEDRRDQYTKVIRDSNGKTTVAEYGMPVHIQNAEGKWEDIDNTLSDNGDHYLTGNTGISIAKEIGKDKDVFSLDNGRITVSLPADTQIKNTAGCVVETEKPSEERTDFEKLTTLDNLTSAVRYKDVLRSTDFVYTVNPYGVKQEIVLNRKAESYSYSFTVRTDGLTLNTDESGDILATDTESGETVYILPAPFAFDSGENYTDAEQCFYTLTDNGEGNYTVTVSVDPEWIDSDERIYPVTIDPTIYHGGYRQGNMRDSIVSQNYPNNNYGSAKYLKAGYDSANANTIIYIAPWSLQSIPAGSYISDAQLNLTANGTNNFSSGKLNLVAKKIIHSGYTSIWGETSVCWNTGCTYGDILDYNNLNAPSSGTVVSWNITSAVRDWYNDSSTFQGIAVMQYDTSSTTSRTIQFHASESTTIQTFINESDELIHITVNGEEIVTTPGHPFYVPVKGWTDACKLRAGDRLQLLNGEYVIVEQVQNELLESPINVYNFEVEDFHTYFVGNESVLVHNSCRGQLRSNMLKESNPPSPDYQAHHGLPWKFKSYFDAAGIDINNPEFGRWVKPGPGGHQSWSKAYEQLWEQYISRHPVPNYSDIIDYFYKLNGGRK